MHRPRTSPSDRSSRLSTGRRRASRGRWLITVIALWAQAGVAEVTALRAGHLIDPATGGVSTGQVILVDAGKITAVGAELEVPEGATVVDLSSSWVMPGLMDAHTHLTYGYPPSPPSGPVGQMNAPLLEESTGLRALRGIHVGGIVLRAGFTTLKEIGNAGQYADTDMREAIERGWFDGPTLLNAGKIIAPFGGQVPDISFENGPWWQLEYIDADSPDEIRKAVRRNIYYGATTIKLVADPAAYYYTEEEIRAAVDEAHRAGLTVAVHVVRDEPARHVILGGADAIEHGIFLSNEILELMKEHGTVLVGTDFPTDHLVAMFGEARGRRFGEAFLDRLKRAHELDVPMAFGTDVVVDLPGKTRAEMMLEYLDVWLDAGVPPAKILRCMTTETARLFRIQDERGAIAKGQWADVIATRGNPLDDIHALETVHFVMKNGKIVRRDQSE